MKVEKLITDNGSQFADRSTRKRNKPPGEHAFDRVCVLLGIEHRLIKPRHPQINGMVERFNGRPRDECLNEHWFTRLKYARVVMARGHPVELWRRGYHDERPRKHRAA
jgi:transposase InsO family protein